MVKLAKLPVILKHYLLGLGGVPPNLIPLSQKLLERPSNFITPIETEADCMKKGAKNLGVLIDF